MQAGAMGQKIRLEWDGEEKAGLISIAEIPLEKLTAEVPGFGKIFSITNGTIRIPDSIPMSYRGDRDSDTREFLRDWYFNDEVKDGTLIATDGHGVEFERFQLLSCELRSQTIQGWEAGTPAPAVIPCVVIPQNVVKLS